MLSARPDLKKYTALRFRQEVKRHADAIGPGEDVVLVFSEPGKAQERGGPPRSPLGGSRPNHGAAVQAACTDAHVAGIENCARGINAMAREEAAYWLGMAMHRRNPRLVLAALRLLLSAS